MRTDTTRIPVIDGQVLNLPDTEPIDAPWLRPPVTAIYRRPNRWHRFRTSPFVEDVKAGARRGVTFMAGALTVIAAQVIGVGL
jgi:hypothetical protein